MAEHADANEADAGEHRRGRTDLWVEEPSDFLIRESALLDDGCLEGWLSLLDPDIDYRVPVRNTPGDTSTPDFSTTAFFYKEDASSLNARVARMETAEAWCENPRTRTRRLVTNVRVERSGGMAQALSNLALFCYRADASTPAMITAERHDTLRRYDTSWRLLRRIVYLDSTVLGLQSLSVFL